MARRAVRPCVMPMISTFAMEHNDDAAGFDRLQGHNSRMEEQGIHQLDVYVRRADDGHLQLCFRSHWNGSIVDQSRHLMGFIYLRGHYRVKSFAKHGTG